MLYKTLFELFYIKPTNRVYMMIQMSTFTFNSLQSFCFLIVITFTANVFLLK